MKRYDYIQFGALSVLSHIAQGAAFILLFAAFGGTGTTSSFTFATPGGLALGVAYVSALSFLFGWGRRPERAGGLRGPLLMAGGLVICTAYLVDGSYNPVLYFRF